MAVFLISCGDSVKEEEPEVVVVETTNVDIDTIQPPDAIQDNVKVEKDSMDTVFPKDNAL